MPPATARPAVAPPQTALPASTAARPEVARPTVAGYGAATAAGAAAAAKTAGSGKKVWWIAGAVAVIAALGIIGWRIGVAQARAKNPDTGVLQAQGRSPKTGVLQVEGAQPKTGILQAEGNKPNQPAVMPKDIEDWLKHLAECERRRVAITKDELASAMVEMTNVSGIEGGAQAAKDIMNDKDPKPPGEGVAAMQGKMREEWTGLLTFFRSKPPPARCHQLAMSYDKVLVNTNSDMLEMMDIIQKVGDDPKGAVSRLQTMRGSTSKDIDLPGAWCDTEVAAICRQYNKDKWFVIHADIGGQFASVGGGM